MKKIELDFTDQIKAQKEDHEVSMAKTQLQATKRILWLGLKIKYLKQSILSRQFMII